jgi:hypothetical protein
MEKSAVSPFLLISCILEKVLKSLKWCLRAKVLVCAVGGGCNLSVTLQVVLFQKTGPKEPLTATQCGAQLGSKLVGNLN